MDMSSIDHSITLKDVNAIVEAVKTKYDFDFSNYALSSFQRRIARILSVHKIPTVDILIQKVIGSPEFYDTFLEEITVNTTEMFRDPDMWKYLKEQVLPELKNKSSINIWHAGCSSGEEVYSMAIMLSEFGIYDKCNLMATDINNTVIQKAKLGEYTSRNMELNDANYGRYGGTNKFQDYYRVEDRTAIMNKDLLRNVTFKVHNLAMDDAFSKFDIVLCRNVMIYFDKVLQEKVFNLFYKSLNKNGFFIMGSKESMIWSSIVNKFKKVNDKEKIFQVIA